MHLNLSFITQNFSQVSFLNLPKNLNLAVDISIDSRTIKPGQFYLALKGENFEGHLFINDALKNGARGIIINENQKKHLEKVNNKFLDEIIFLIVEDTHKFLLDLAHLWRQSFDIPVVGITGSVGKTTTKQMLANILKTSNINSFISFKNQNNLIGLPLNILKLTDEYKVAVFELGISRPGEMEILADILRPTICIITNISSAHVSGLGNLKKIAEEKLKIFKFLKNDQIGILWGDQNLIKKSFNHPVVKFGFKKSNHIQARKIKLISTEDKKIQVSFEMFFYQQRFQVNLAIGHSGFVNNALAAASVAHFLDIDLKTIIDSLESYSGFEQRFEQVELKNKKGFLINDCYNACPQSMKAAIQAFDEIKNNGPKIAILGDMLELGKKKLYWHRQIGRLIAKSKTITNLILVGQCSKVIAQVLPFSIKVEVVNDWHEAKNIYSKLINQKNNLTLVKASHGIELYKLVQEFIQ
ncbi:MAG: UDP-N-acetylmuramoyl-tripeptide--D-alanyl-D-alanine ligase [bacterium]